LLLEVTNLELAYGEVPAVRDVSFEVAEGEIVTLIGANGAGKSTTMRGVAGSMLSRKGKILFDGVDVTRLPATLAPRPASRSCPRAGACSLRSPCARTSRWAASGIARTEKE